MTVNLVGYRADGLVGIIASVRDGGNEGDIEEVKSLVMNIIQRPSCLILLVVSCESNITSPPACFIV